MNYLLLIAGILILVFSIADLAYTTFSSNGAGLLTDTITKGIWNFSLMICRQDGSKKMLRLVGIITIGVIVITWFLLIWLGSSLIICADENSVIDSSTNSPASIWEKVYYTGFTLSTLGVGDYKASKDIWRIYTVVLSLAGFMLITTAISYMLPVLSADVFKKNLSTYITVLGRNPQDILLNHWKDGSFHSLEPHFTNLMQMVIMHTQQMLAYPVLFCFHNSNVNHSTALNIAKLDEALTILLLKIPENSRPSTQAILPLRKVITNYLMIQSNYFIKPKEAYPFIPSFDELRKAGIPMIKEQESIQRGYSKLAKRRELIGAVLRNEGWEFKDIYKVRSLEELKEDSELEQYLS